MRTPPGTPGSDEIERRVAETDAALSARRIAAARQVGALAQRHAAVAEQLGEIERQLGEVLADAEDVVTVGELARFTDVPAADLTRWREGRKPTRAKRRKTPTAAPSQERGEPTPTARASTAPTQTPATATPVP